MKLTARFILALLGLVLARTGHADDWPQYMGPNRDGVWKEKDLIDKFPDKGIKPLWSVKIGGGYAGPAVADGRVYVMDYQTDTDVQTAGLSNPGARPKIKGKERLLCLDARTGKELWKYVYDRAYEISYPCGPRCTPTVAGGKVYMLGAEGNLTCLDAKKGTKVWTKDLNDVYKTKTPIWGYTGHPLVDGKKVYVTVGGKGSVLVCFDADTGKEKWKALDAREPGYCPPTMITAGGKKQLVLWTPKTLNGLDPETGTKIWSEELEPNYSMSIMAPRQSGDYLFAGGIGGKALTVKLSKDGKSVSEVWRGKRTTGVYPINMTPIVDDGIIYGVDQPGQLRAVEIATGKRLWETFAPVAGKQAGSGTAFLVKNGDRYFIFNEKGELIIAKLTRAKYTEVSKTKLLDPTGLVFGRKVVWSHPAYANKCIFARNDKEIVCVSLAK